MNTYNAQLNLSTDNTNNSSFLFQGGVFIYCLTELEKLDLEFINMRFITIDEFYKIVMLELVNSDKEGFAIYVSSLKKRCDPKHIKILIPIDYRRGLLDDIYTHVSRVLLLSQPSAIRFLGFVNIKIINEVWLYNSVTEQALIKPLSKSDNLEPHSLDHAKIKVLQKLFETYFNRFELLDSSNKYLKTCVDNYGAHFYQWDISLSYLSLCICLEALVEGKEQVTYRIKRNLCVINSSNTEHGRKLFKEIGDIYTLRSKIVHGEVYDKKDLVTKLPILQNLVASTILELLSHEKISLKELNEKINELGYGEKERLTNLYSKDFIESFSLI